MGRSVNADNPGLPRRLTRLRNRAGLTRQELADKAGVTFNTVNDIEKGRRPHPMEKTLQCIAQVLEVPYEYLAFGEAYAGGVPQDGSGVAAEESGRVRRGIAAAMLVLIVAFAALHAYWERTRSPAGYDCVVKQELTAPCAMAFEDVDSDGAIEWIQASGASRTYSVSEIDRTDPDAWRIVRGPQRAFTDSIQVPVLAHDLDGDGNKELFNVCVSGSESRIEVVDALTGAPVATYAGLSTTPRTGGLIWTVDVEVAAVRSDFYHRGEVAVVRSNTAGDGGVVCGIDLATGRELWQYTSPVAVKTVRVADVNGDGEAEIFLWGSVQPGEGQEHGSPSRAYAASLDARGQLRWHRYLSDRCAEVSAALLEGGAREGSLVFSAVNTGGRRRASTSYILLLDASSGARVDSLPYTEMIVSNPLVSAAPGTGAWNVYCGTEHGSVRRYRVEGEHVSMAAQRVLGRDWVWPARFLTGENLDGAFIVASADHHSYILDGELRVLLNRTGLDGAPITPLASFAGSGGVAYVAFLCHGSDVCIDRVVADSGWSVRKWLLLGYLLPLAGLALTNDRLRTTVQRFSL